MRNSNGRPGQEAAAAENLNSSSLTRGTDKMLAPGSCLAAGLGLAKLGIHVFPLTAGKKPLRLCGSCRPPSVCPGRDECRCGVDTCHGFYAATTDADTIIRWWRRHPDWQLGIRTGQPSGLVVLDVDLDKDGLDSLIALQRVGLDIRGTAVQLSGSGKSFHLIYAHPGGYVPSSQGKLGPGLDVRGDGGYVVGAPSLHASTGVAYELLGDLTDLPPWPLESAPARPRPCQDTSSSPMRHPSETTGSPLTATRLNALVDKVRRAPEGTRRSALFWAACRLGECAGTQGTLVVAAEELLQAALYAGLGFAEAYSTLLDGIRIGRSS